MDEKESVEKVVKRGSQAGTHRKRYTFEEKLRAVKLRLEEGFGLELVCAEMGVSKTSLGVWLRQEGEMGLRRQVTPHAGRRLAPRCGKPGFACQGMITVSINKKVLPNYPLKYAYR